MLLDYEIVINENTFVLKLGTPVEVRCSFRKKGKVQETAAVQARSTNYKECPEDSKPASCPDLEWVT